MNRISMFFLAATALSASTAAFAMSEPAAEPTAAEDVPAAKPAAVAEPKTPAVAPSRDYVIVRVGDEEIKNSEATELWKGLFPGGTAPDFNSFDEKIRQNVLRGIISEKLIYQEALREGYDKSPEVKKRMENLKKQLVMQTFMENKAKTLVTEQELKDAYAKRAAEMKTQKEVRARHILVETKEEALALQAKLKKGADFKELAEEKSLDTASGAAGGDLGYFTEEAMVPEFSAIAYQLKPGEVSSPVKTSFGWHLIKVDDKRPVRVPPFEEMRDELQAEISNDIVQDYVETLLKKSDIKYYGPDGKQRSFSASIEPAAGQ